MPRYFFHVSDDQGWTKDHEGSQFDSEAGARAEAVKAGKGIVGRKLTMGSALDDALVGKVVVTDEHEQILFTLTFSEAARAAADTG